VNEHIIYDENAKGARYEREKGRRMFSYTQAHDAINWKGWKGGNRENHKEGRVFSGVKAFSTVSLLLSFGEKTIKESFTPQQRRGEKYSY
jgi:hypothetical protein